MNYNITPFQGLPIYHSDTNYLLKNKEKQYLDSLSYYNSKPNNRYITKDTYILNNSNLLNLKKLFNQHIEFYLKEILQIKNQLKLTQSWVTINKQNQKHHTHYHRNCFLSIVFYPQVKSGSLFFSSNRCMLQQGYDFAFENIKPNMYNSFEIKFKPTPSSLFIFPGWVSHGTTKNKSNIDRVMIGANYFFKGTLGKKENYNELSL
tara:strand:+ start:8 stop:622 length:615 start_codon:yes stop_codon:yes gene_type:complete